MASLRLCNSVISPKIRTGVVSSSIPYFSHFSPSRVSLGVYDRINFPKIVSTKLKEPIYVSVKANGASPDFESNFSEEFEISNLNSNETNKEYEIPSLISNEETEIKQVQKEAVVPTKKYARLHDFCLGIPFGALLFVMGSLGFIIWRSPVSLVLGVVPGFATFALGVLSLMVWRKNMSNFIFIFAQAAVASFLALQYSQAYSLTKKFLPWGFYAFLSIAMLCFFIYVVLSGGNPPPKKAFLS